MDRHAVSYARLFLSMWLAFALIRLLQSWSLAVSIVPALLPALICVSSFALSALVTEHFWSRVLWGNLLIGLTLGLLHFNVPESYIAWQGGKLLVQGGRHTAFGHLLALLDYAVIVAGNLIGFVGYRYWVASSSRLIGN